MRPLLLLFPVAAAFAATTLLRSTFDQGPAPWSAMGENATVRVSQDAADLREGKPSLAIDYEIGPGKFGAAVLPIDTGAFATMDQIHFWVKTDYPTSVILILREKDGGSYNAPAWSPGGVWQEVKLEPRDFTLGDGPNDPPDPDGKLDLDQLQGIGLADLGQLFGAAPPNPDAPIITSRHPGKHTMLISGFEVLSGAAERKDKLAVDRFDSPQLLWISPGGAALRLDTSHDHAPAAALEVTFTESDKGIVFFARNLPPDIPADVTHISFDIASEKDAQLIFSLQCKGPAHVRGPRYNTTVDVNGGGKSDHRDLALSAFNLDSNGPPDPAGELRISTVKTLAIGDISAVANAGHGPNKLWLSNVRLTVR